MKKKFSFREPLGQDLNGLYITAAQMRFFLNRRSGGKKFMEGNPEFFKYFYRCAVYNVIWDLTELDPSCATYYWDEGEGSMAIKFPPKGRVMEEFKKRQIAYVFDEEH